MGTKYATILVGGVVQTYNDGPPSDDGAQTEANRVKYSTITTDLTAPLHSATIRMDGNLVAHVNEGPTPKNANYTTVLADHNSVIEASGASTTISLLNPTSNKGYQVAVKNAGSSDVTVNVDGGANVDGASSRTLIPGAGARFRVNDGETAYLGDTMYPLDEDDLASDSATYTATQQSVKAYVDARTITAETAQATTSGTEFDFPPVASDIFPTTVQRIQVLFNGVSLSAGDDILVQLETASGVIPTGYVSQSMTVSSSPTGANSTSGLVVSVSNDAAVVSGIMTLVKISGNIWVSSHAMSHTAAPRTIVGGGHIDAAAAVEGVRITRSGSNTFDAGSVNVIYESY